jgi:hypothetical protein
MEPPGYLNVDATVDVAEIAANDLAVAHQLDDLQGDPLDRAES